MSGQLQLNFEVGQELWRRRMQMDLKRFRAYASAGRSAGGALTGSVFGASQRPQSGDGNRSFSNPQDRHLISGGVVIARFGHRNRASFWQFVHRSGVPCVRLNARRIVFDGRQLNDGIKRRSKGARGRAW